MHLDDDYADRLRDLADYITPGPWEARRSAVSGDLLLWDGDEPLALIYAGHDFARYLVEVAPAILFGGAR